MNDTRTPQQIANDAASDEDTQRYRRGYRAGRIEAGDSSDTWIEDTARAIQTIADRNPYLAGMAAAWRDEVFAREQSNVSQGVVGQFQMPYE